ncbi:MAG: PAS domain S-box protein, partial [Methanomicrobium sp.]|nr:PAS domain S-box protein [Methanomicrobium sp.]
MGTGYLPDDKKITKYYSAIIASTSAAALIMTVVCLNINNYFIYPHLYYIPIVIAAIIYPKKGVYFAILLAVLLIFISIVVTKGNIEIIRENLVNGIVFTGVGAIASALSDVLRSDSLKYQRLFENSGAATAVIDKSDKIIYCNKEFENISGYDLKEIKRKKWTDLISPDDLNKIFSDSELKTLQNPKNLKGIEVRILKNKGETRHTLAS